MTGRHEELPGVPLGLAEPGHVLAVGGLVHPLVPLGALLVALGVGQDEEEGLARAEVGLPVAPVVLVVPLGPRGGAVGAENLGVQFRGLVCEFFNESL